MKIGEKFYPPIFKVSEFRILDADKMLSPCRCHSFLRKTVPTASKQTGNKEQKGEVEKKCFAQGWNEGKQQIRIKKRALQHPMSAMLSSQ